LKLFLITSRVPYPLEKGDKLRAFHFLRELSRYNELYLFCISGIKEDEKALQELKKFCKEVHFYKLHFLFRFFSLFRSLFQGKPFQVGWFYSSSAASAVNKLVSRIQPDVFFCQLVRTAEYLPKAYAGIKVIDYMDAFSVGMQRRYTQSRFPMSQVYRYEYEKLTAYEEAVMHRFHLHLIISDQDKGLMPKAMQPMLKVLRNGVDLAYYRYEDAQEYKVRNELLLFSGNMSYPPNIQAAHYLVEKILPLVHQHHPKARVTLAGARPTASVKKMGGKDVRVTGWINDLRHEYSQAKVFVAPMFSGTGMQNKLLEAMAMALPCITTRMAAEAINGEHMENIIIADDEKSFSEAINFLLSHPEEAKNLGLKGRKHVEHSFSWQHHLQELQNWLIDEKGNISR
jgi:sugar transferase (PEP-CTERM/EpsH1 system associated)